MNQSNVSALNSLAFVLGTVRCFNAAAFVALAFFYFAAYSLPAPPSHSLKLSPLAQINH